MANAAKKLVIESLRPADFGLISHKVTQFSATVPGTLNKADLENPDLWVNVANKMVMGNDIRCLADDMSFVAYGICTFAQGSTVKIKIISMHKLDAVDYDALSGEAADYKCKLRGPKKWCIVQTSTGDVIKEGMATQLEALKELKDYEKALRA